MRARWYDQGSEKPALQRLLQAVSVGSLLELWHIEPRAVTEQSSTCRATASAIRVIHGILIAHAPCCSGLTAHLR